MDTTSRAAAPAKMVISARRGPIIRGHRLRRYTWVNAFGKIAALNTPPCFADKCDWRLPSLFELETLRDMGEWGPAVSPAFNNGFVPGCTFATCSLTRSNFYYWTSTSRQFNPENAWFVNFDEGYVGFTNKSTPAYVRAVRGGS